MKKVVLVFSFVSFALFSCENSDLNTPDPTQATGNKYASEQEKTDVVNYFPPKDPVDDPGNCASCGTVTWDLPQSPAVFDGSPLIAQGKPSSSFTPTGQYGGAESIAFGPAKAETNFPFSVPSGAAKLIMGFTIKVDASHWLVVRGYPVAIANGTPIWLSGAVTTQVIGVTIGASSSVYNCTSECTSYGEANGQVTISQLSLDAQGKLTLTASIFVGGAVYNTNKVSYVRTN